MLWLSMVMIGPVRIMIKGVEMMVCDGCGADVDIECTVTVDGLSGVRVYRFCGYCASELDKWFKRM